MYSSFVNYLFIDTVLLSTWRGGGGSSFDKCRKSSDLVYANSVVRNVVKFQQIISSSFELTIFA